MHKHRFGDKRTLIILGMVMLVGAVLAGAINILFGTIADLALAKDISGILNLSKWIIMVALLGVGIRFIGNALERRYLYHSNIALKSDYMSRYLRLSPEVLYSSNHSTHISHLTNDADRLENQYYQNIIGILEVILTLLVTIIVLVSIWWKFIFVIVAMMFVFVMMARKSSEPVKKEEKQKSIHLDRYTEFIEETLNGFQVIIQHQLEKMRLASFEKIAQTLKQQQIKLEHKITQADALNNVIQSLIIVSLMVLGLGFSNRAGFSFGETLIIVLLFSELIWPLQRITPLIVETMAISELFKTFENDLGEETQPEKISEVEFEKLELKDVDLGYDVPIIRDVNLVIHMSEKVLIVGPSGAGKSTLLKTILKQVNPLNGDVLINDSNMNLRSYLSNFSVVDQIGFIFNGSLKDNVSMLANVDIDKGLERVGLDYLDRGSILQNDGKSLSGGERARLLLARAIVFNKPVIVSDEIMASLDRDVAIGIERDLLELDQTVLNVSHIVFEENLDLYDKFWIVENGDILETTDSNLVLSRMLDYEESGAI